MVSFEGDTLFTPCFSYLFLLLLLHMYVAVREGGRQICRLLYVVGDCYVIRQLGVSLAGTPISRLRLHCKPSPFDKQFCMANTAIYTSNITFQGNQKKIFQPRQI
jgi:hypothetical protein